MTTGNSQTVQIRHEWGAVVKIDDGTTQTFLKLKMPGTINYKIGGYGSITTREGGALLAALEGDAMQCELNMDFYFSGTANAASVYKLLGKRNTSSGAKQTFAVSIWVPAYRGATTGDLIVFNQCFLPENGREVRAGGTNEPDRLTIRLIDNEPEPTTTDATTAPT